MDQQSLEYARLSGIEIPKGLLQAVDDADGRLSNLIEKRSELETEREGLEVEAQALIREEAAVLVAGGDSKKLSTKRQKGAQRCAEIGHLLVEIGKLEAAAKSSLAKTEEELACFINERQTSGRVVMKAQLERAMEERGRNLNQVGQIFSTLPEETSRSRIAVCEICSRDIGIFDPETICRPVSASHFEKLPRFDAPPFRPEATIEYFQCPYCRKRPWGEFDRVLTNFGFYCVKKEEKEDAR